MQTNYALTNDRIMKYAPVAATRRPQEGLSDKYSYISTLDVVDMLRGEGWYPSFARQSRVRDENNEGFQKHLVRMRHPNLAKGKEFVEIVIINSYNGKSSFQFMMGIYRLVCSNGLILGDTFDHIRVKHIGLSQADVIEAAHQGMVLAPKITNAIDVMKRLSLASEERRIFANSALQMMYDEPEKESPINSVDLLVPRRSTDNQSDLWTTFNVVQENIHRGGIHGKSKATGKRITTRRIKSIDKDLRIGKALWTLTEKMAELKGRALA